MTPIAGFEGGEELYRGSHSTVVRARRASDRKTVILKAPASPYPSPAEIAKVHHEYDILTRIQSPRVVRCFGLEQQNGIPWLILEDFGAQSLRSVIAASRMDLLTFLQIAVQLAEALGAIHQRHVIHKDINSSNILINPKTGEVKVIDFGIASMLSREDPGISLPQALEGTLPYISPEQTGRMNRALDYRTDFYSLGITLYEALIGWVPFQTRDPMELIHCHIAKLPTPPHELNRSIPKTVSDIIMKLVAKTAEERYQTAHGLRADFERCLLELQTAGRIDGFVPGAKDISDKFQIPQRLYGRDEEIARLLEAFDRACEGGKELAIVSGYAGIGKSALVLEVQKPIVRRRGYFIRGKFDQFLRNVPYASLAQAFRDLVRQLLTSRDEELEIWRFSLREALGPNARVLSDVIPEIALIVGDSPAVQELPPLEAQNRFNDVFRGFVRTVAREDHPLVLFLDDLQWADLASLTLLHLLLTDPEGSYLLIVGGSRDDEITGGHPTGISLASMEEAGVPITRISLTALEKAVIARIVGDTLQCDEKEAAPLAALVYQKTGGNPYFVNEFLRTLHQQGLVVFNYDAHRWQWELAAIQAMDITDNIVALMAERIRKLGSKTQRCLQLAACIGSQFDLETLTGVLEEPHARTARELWEAIQEGLILPVGDAYKFVPDADGAGDRPAYQPPSNYSDVSFKFSHDRVQQAAYSLIPEPERLLIHLQIGRSILKNSRDGEFEDRIFDIATHLDLGCALIQDEGERLELARLNLLAGRKAKSSAAFDPARLYFTAGTELIRESDWQLHYELSFELFSERAQCEYLTGSFSKAEEYFSTLLGKAVGNVDRAKVYNMMVAMYDREGELHRALEVGIAGLASVGQKLAPNPGVPAVLIEILQSRWRLRKHRIQELIRLKPMTDARASIALETLMNLSANAYATSEQLWAIEATRMVNITLKYGNAEASSFAYGVYGLLMIGVFRDYAAGREFGLLAIELSRKFKGQLMLGRCCFVMASVLNHWRAPARTNLDYLQEAYRNCMESGDHLYVTRAHMHVSITNLFVGAPLDAVARGATESYEFAVQAKLEDSSLPHLCFKLQAQCLRGLTSPTGTFDSAEIPEQQLRIRLESSPSTYFRMYYYVGKLQAACLYGRHAEVPGLIAESKKIRHTLTGQLVEVEYHFYSALSFAFLAGRPGEASSRHQLRGSLKKLKGWARHSPENFSSRAALVEAELARIEGRTEEAMALYDRAIELAHDHRFVQIGALANELAGRFYCTAGRRKAGAAYLREAVHGYRSWGAEGKARLLAEEFSDLFTDRPQPASASDKPETETTSTRTETLDLTTVLKASQALSGEIVLERFLERMLKIVTENAGAQRCLLVMEKEGDLVVEAEWDVQSQSLSVLTSRAIAGSTRLSETIIRFVARTGEYVVLADACREGLFTGDPYVLSAGSKSVLCMPIMHQGKTTGILYLENNLTSGAFTPERLEILRLLSSQIATSLENARLHEQEKALARMHEELRLAAQIQLNLLPKSPPELPGYEIVGVNIPAQVVGGDYFDFIPISDLRCAICLGDVSGKGLPASLLMSNLQATLRGQTLLETAPRESLRRSNKLLYQSTSPEKFATLFYCILDAGKHQLHYSNAGHDHPFLIRGGEIVARLKSGGIPLGMLEDFSFEEDRISLEPGDTIVMCSDGVPEALNEEEELFGEEKVIALLTRHADLPPGELISVVVEAVKRFAGAHRQSDDVTLVVLRRKP